MALRSILYVTLVSHFHVQFIIIIIIIVVIIVAYFLCIYTLHGIATHRSHAYTK